MSVREGRGSTYGVLVVCVHMLDDPLRSGRFLCFGGCHDCYDGEEWRRKAKAADIGLPSDLVFSAKPHGSTVARARLPQRLLLLLKVVEEQKVCLDSHPKVSTI